MNDLINSEIINVLCFFGQKLIITVHENFNLCVAAEVLSASNGLPPLKIS